MKKSGYCCSDATHRAIVAAAIDNTGIRGRYKLAAGVVWRKRLVAIGLNRYKTHPVMMNREYKEEQIYLHAEVDAILKAAKLIGPERLRESALHVVRVRKVSPTGKYEEALARPCRGCMALIAEFGIKEVSWTT